MIDHLIKILVILLRVLCQIHSVRDQWIVEVTQAIEAHALVLHVAIELSCSECLCESIVSYVAHRRRLFASTFRHQTSLSASKLFDTD